VFQTKVVEEIKTYILWALTFFFLNCAVCKIMWKKHCRVGQATDDNRAHAHCMLHTSGYKYIHSGLCNTRCFSTAILVARTRLNVTFIPTAPALFSVYLSRSFLRKWNWASRKVVVLFEHWKPKLNLRPSKRWSYTDLWPSYLTTSCSPAGGNHLP